MNHLPPRSGVRASAWLPFLLSAVLSLPLARSDQETDGKLPEVICFGSCSHQEKPQPIIDAIVADEPDLFIYLGDNIYADTKEVSELKRHYATLAAKPEFLKLKRATRLLSTWDDHDYGWNDAGKEYALKKESEQIFLDFWDVPKDHARRKHEGIYGEYRFSGDGRTVQILILDTRYFRDPLLRRQKGDEFKNAYKPDPSPEKTLLGDAQWKWLEKCLRKPADLRIVCSSIQFGHEYNGWESWTLLPAEQSRMVKLINETRANGLIFISGDVHWGEISKRTEGLPYPIFDVTSSGLNRDWATIEANHFRVGNPYREHNYGRLRIDWKAQDPVLSMDIVGMDGKAAISHSTTLSKLKVTAK